MKRNKEINQILIQETDKYSQKSYAELSQLSKPYTYEIKNEKNRYLIEVQLLEKRDSYLHALVSVDDGSFFRFMFPLSKSFIVYKE